MPTLLNIQLHLLAICIYCVTAVITFRKRKHKGAPEFITIIFAVILWTILSIFEMQAAILSEKLLWHNISTIICNFITINVYFFTVSFTGMQQRVTRRIRAAVITIFIVMTIMILTSPQFHLIRSPFHINILPDITNITENYGNLQVNYPPLGNIYIVYNLFLIAISIAILIDFYTRVGNLIRRQILYVAFGILLVPILILSDTINQMNAVGEMAVSLILAFSSIMIMIGMYRNQLFSITAFARDKIFDIIDQGVVISSYNGKIIDINKAAIIILNANIKSDIMFNKTKQITEACAKAIEYHYHEWQKSIISMKKSQLEIESIYGTDKKYYSVNIYPIDIQNELVGTISIIKDITNEKKEMAALKVKAEVDGLTDILNRRAFIEYVGNLAGQLDDCSACLWMIFLDVDHFKNINDTYGHAAGDYVLKELAFTVKNAIRKKDIFGRLGGEEFGIFKIAGESSHCLRFCERIRKSIENHAFLYEGNQIDVTISIGCVCIPIDDFTNVESLIKKSDEMMYKAKTNGRNRVEIFERCNQ